MAFKLTKKDKDVVKAWLEGKEASSKKLSSYGESLDGGWLGGSNIGYVKNGKKKLRNTTSKADETIKNYIRKLNKMAGF